jgi:AcrR family transcriptional regulator
MTAKDSAGAPPADDEPVPSRRELAVARSLDPARVRAEKRVQRFLDAALELMEASSGKEFTVQEVVERSGQSLRSFYQYFAGKHELLLALFEESVRWSTEKLRAAIADEDDPLERLHVFAVTHYEICRPRPHGGGSGDYSPVAMAEFAQELLTTRPKEASHAFVPVVTLLEELLDEAAEAGAIRSGLDVHRLAGVLLQAVMFNAFASTISGSPVTADTDDAEALWRLILHGIAPT